MKKIPIVLALLALTACGKDDVKKTDAGSTASLCSDKMALDALSKKYTDLIEAQAATLTSHGVDALLAKGAITQFKANFADVRTEKTEGNKSVCAATVKIDLPAGAVDTMDALTLSTKGGVPDVHNESKTAGLNLTGNALSRSITYTVTPTDDKKSMVVDTDTNNSIDRIVGLIATASIAKSAAVKPVAGMLAAGVTVAGMPAVAAVASPKPVDARTEATKKADMAEARVVYKDEIDRNMSLRQDINSTWANLPEDFKIANLEKQKAWVLRKKANCGNVSTGSDVNMTDEEAIKKANKSLKCDSEMTAKRLEVLTN